MLWTDQMIPDPVSCRCPEPGWFVGDPTTLECDNVIECADQIQGSVKCSDSADPGDFLFTWLYITWVHGSCSFLDWNASWIHCPRSHYKSYILVSCIISMETPEWLCLQPREPFASWSVFHVFIPFLHTVGYTSIQWAWVLFHKTIFPGSTMLSQPVLLYQYPMSMSTLPQNHIPWLHNAVTTHHTSWMTREINWE